MWVIWTVLVQLSEKAGFAFRQISCYEGRTAWGFWGLAAHEQGAPLPYATVIILAKKDGKDTAWKVETATKITSEDASSEQLST